MRQSYVTSCVMQSLYNGFRGPHYDLIKRKGYQDPHALLGSRVVVACQDFFDGAKEHFSKEGKK